MQRYCSVKKDKMSTNETDWYDKNPKKFQYIWFSIHAMAINASTIELRRAFAHYMRMLCKTLPCKKCRVHLKSYILEHPPEIYFDYIIDGKNVGCFYWSWLFHNKVNGRLKKKELPFNSCYEYYSKLDLEVCEKSDCGDGETTRKTVRPVY